MALSASNSFARNASGSDLPNRQTLQSAFNRNEERLAGSENREIANQIITQVLKNDFR